MICMKKRMSGPLVLWVVYFTADIHSLYIAQKTKSFLQNFPIIFCLNQITVLPYCCNTIASCVLNFPSCHGLSRHAGSFQDGRFGRVVFHLSEDSTLFPLVVWLKTLTFHSCEPSASAFYIHQFDTNVS